MKPSVLFFVHERIALLWLGGLGHWFKSNRVPVQVMTEKHYPPPMRGAVLKKRLPLLPIARHILEKKVAKHAHCFVWTDRLNPVNKLFAEACDATGTPITFMESGYFPQRDFFSMDSTGVNANSALMDDPLDWITQKHIDAIEKIRQSHLQGYKWVGGGDYILIPLQIETDAQIKHHSPFKTMQEFINHCEQEFPNRKLIFKRHPLDRNQYQSRHHIETGKLFWKMAFRADLVYGINSTCLLESLLLGAPTESIGDGFIKAHKHQPQKILAALVDHQIPVLANDMSYWLNKYSAVKK